MTSTPTTPAVDSRLDVGRAETITEGMTSAWKQAQVDSLAQQVTRLLDSIGPRLTAVALGLRDARMLLTWQAGESPRKPDVLHRAQVAAEVVYAVTAVYPGTVAASFLRSSQPALDGDSPLLLIRDTPADELPALQHRLRSAVRAFLEG